MMDLGNTFFFKSLSLTNPIIQQILAVSLTRELFPVFILTAINFNRYLNRFLAPFRRQAQESTCYYQSLYLN